MPGCRQAMQRVRERERRWKQDEARVAMKCLVPAVRIRLEACRRMAATGSGKATGYEEKT